MDCSSGMTFQGEFADKFLHDPAPYHPGRVNPNPLGCDTGIFADFRDCPSPATSRPQRFGCRLAAGAASAAHKDEAAVFTL